MTATEKARAARSHRNRCYQQQAWRMGEEYQQVFVRAIIAARKQDAAEYKGRR